jgi:hypothetical protein
MEHVVGAKEDQETNTIENANELKQAEKDKKIDGQYDTVVIKNTTTESHVQFQLEEVDGLKRRKRANEQCEDDVRSSYRTRSKKRASMEAKKRVLRPRSKN